MYADFIQSGPEFKTLYLEEDEILEEFHLTILVALHKKGNMREPSNYQFLHLRDWLSRLLELMIYQKLELVFHEKMG